MNNKTDRYLTGITCTGTPHLGNYVGAIRPAIEAARNESFESFFFLADWHALIKSQSPERVTESSLAIAATWLALGLDVERSVFYRQSDVPEIAELNWVLSCVCAKGLMNRAHAYKASVEQNIANGNDADYAITMGLYQYPVLMSADILLFNANKIPVGKDQVQHVEMARDIAGRFNHIYGKTIKLPEAVVDESVPLLNGLDGRKMSKSYDNTIPMFLEPKKLKKAVNKIKTNLLEPGEPKDPNTSTVFQVWAAFASPEETERMRHDFAQGIGWGDAKKQLITLLDSTFEEAREKYQNLIANPLQVEEILRLGAERARQHAVPLMQEIKERVGIRPMC